MRGRSSAPPERARGVFAIFIALLALGTQTTCHSANNPALSSSGTANSGSANSGGANSGSANSSPANSSPANSAPTTTLPLQSLLPATGVSWALRLHPRRLLSDELLLHRAQPLLTPERLMAFQSASGIDLQQVNEMWFAGYPLATLLLLQSGRTEAKVIESFAARAQSSARTDSSTGDSTSITGIVDGKPHSLFALHNQFVAVADGDPSLTKFVRARTEGKLSATPSALQTRLMRPISRDTGDSAAVLFLFGPFERATDAVMHGFVAGAVEFEHRDGVLLVEIRARGVWPADSIAVNAWLMSLLSTPELQAFGFGRPLAPSSTSCSAEGPEESEDLTFCRIRLKFSVADVAESAYLVTQASMAELLGPRSGGNFPTGN